MFGNNKKLLAEIETPDFFTQTVMQYKSRKEKESRQLYKKIKKAGFEFYSVPYESGIPGFKKMRILGTQVYMTAMVYGIHFFDDSHKEYVIPWSQFVGAATNDEVKDGVLHNMGKAGMVGMMTTGSALGSVAAGATMGKNMAEAIVGKEGFIVIQYRQSDADDLVHETLFKTRAYKKIKEALIQQRQRAIEQGYFAPAAVAKETQTSQPDKYAQLEQLNKLKNDGVLTEDEFQTEKQKILNT
jgi:putative oligomerization/nucleic acid binding protein